MTGAGESSAKASASTPDAGGHEPRPSSTRRVSLPLGITFFRMVSEHGSDVASLHTPDGVAIFVAPSVERAFGWQSNDLQGRPFFEFVHEADRGRVEQAFATALEQDATGRATYRLRTASGQWVWVESLTQATPSRGDGLVVCMTRDVSSQKRAEKALEDGIVALALRQPDGVLIVQNGRIVHANPAALAEVGLTREVDAVELAMASVLHPDCAAEELAELERVATTGSASAAHDLRLLRRDGSDVAVQGSSVGVSFGGQGAALLFLREKPRPDTQAITADRLRSIGTVAAGLAHELADPVALLLSSLEMLAAEDIEDGASRAKAEALRQAQSSGHRIFEALRALRSFSRGDEDLRRNIDVREVADAVLNVVSARVAPTTRIVRDFDSAPILVHADQARLSQALFNLVSNAVDAANLREVGEVRFICRADTRGGALIEVTDNGQGIEPNSLPRVFEPFFTTKPVATAVGLGLPVSNTILRSMGGRLELESMPGVGTIASVQLPPAPAARSRATDGTPQPSFVPSSTIRVAPAPAPCAPKSVEALPRLGVAGARAKLLVLDDEVALGSTLRRLFRRDYDVEVEITAEGALRRIVTGERFDLILCDLLLPGMSGIDFYGELQEVAPSMVARVVFVTGGMITPGTQAFLDALPNTCVDKPFIPSELRERLQRLLVDVGPAQEERPTERTGPP